AYGQGARAERGQALADGIGEGAVVGDGCRRRALEELDRLRVELRGVRERDPLDCVAAPVVPRPVEPGVAHAAPGCDQVRAVVTRLERRRIAGRQLIAPFLRVG